MSATCLVTGATGFIGSHIVDALLARGDNVVCLTRKSSDLRWLRDKRVTFAWGDVTAPDSLPSALHDVDYVFHAAGLTRAHDPGDFDRVNHQGTVNLLQACKSSARRLRRFVLVSSQAAAGPSPGERPVTEADPCQPVSLYGQSKWDAEIATASYLKEFPITIVRPPAVYGPRDDATLPIFRIAAHHILPLPSSPRRVSIISWSDLTAGILLAAGHPHAEGRTYFIAHDVPVSIPDVARMTARALGVWVVPVPAPAWAVRAYITGLRLFVRAWTRRQAFGKDKSGELDVRYWLCDGSRATQELGFRAATPHEEGIRATALWYRQQGWL